MVSEITEEITDQEDPNFFINTQAQREKIRKIIRHQQSLYSSSSSSSAASCSSSLSSSSQTSLLELMKVGSTSLRRLFEMEHTSLATHFEYYSGSPIIKPISLWDSDSEREFEDPWKLIKQIGSSQIFRTDDRESELASKGSHNYNLDNQDLGSHHKTKNVRKLSRKKSFRRLPGFGMWRCGRFKFRMKFRRFKLLICIKRLRSVF